MNEVNAKEIMSAMRGVIARKEILAPERWINYGVALTALLGDENDKYATLYQEAHKIQLEVIQSDKTASQAEIEMKASDEYKELLKQKGLCEQIMEMIRLAKIRASMSDKELPLSDI